MTTLRPRLTAVPAPLCLLALLMALPSAGAGATSAQSLLERPPNLQGTWVGQAGTVYFHFMHRFTSTGPPTRKVLQTPTFLVGVGLPPDLLVGAHYATNSTLVPQIPNEWELFARYRPLAESEGAPVELALQAGYNQAARSWDGQLSVAKEVGPLRLLGAGRAFSSAFDQSDARFALAGGANLRFTEHVAVAGDYSRLLDLDDQEGEPAWSAGLQLGIPYTPHTFSLHVTNVRTTTLQGASIGGDRVRYGFEFTVPLTLSRYFGTTGGTGADGGIAPADGGTGAVAAEVGMTNRLTYTPDTVRIAAGETVLWRNSSDVIHTVTADPEKAVDRSHVSLPEGARTFDSGDMPPGATFEHTFTVPGTYQYFCTPHELAGMVGWVIVSDPNAEGEPWD